MIQIFYTMIKTHCCVSAAKKDVWHTSVLFTGTAKLPFSKPHIVGVVDVDVRVSSHLKEELTWAIDKRLWVISTIMLFKKQ